jgi:hypothetical protein
MAPAIVSMSSSHYHSRCSSVVIGAQPRGKIVKDLMVWCTMNDVDVANVCCIRKSLVLDQSLSTNVRS